MAETSTTIQGMDPGLKLLFETIRPKLETLAGAEVNTDAMTAEVAPMNDFQKESMIMAAKQAGLGIPQFDANNVFTGVSGGTGIAGYQKYLDKAETGYDTAQDAADDQYATTAKADAEADKAAQAAEDGQDAGAAANVKAGEQYDKMAQAAEDGQDAAQPYMDAADAEYAKANQAYSDAKADADAARQYTGANAYQQFMSPYQQEVIDASLAQQQQEAAIQQSNLASNAGNAFGGGRFGVAQGVMGAQAAMDQATLVAQLKAQGYTNAQASAQAAFQNQMGLSTSNMNLGQAYMGAGAAQGQQGQMALAQALQNQNMYGTAGQAYNAQATAEQQQVLNNQNLFTNAAKSYQDTATSYGQASTAANTAATGMAAMSELQQKQAATEYGITSEFGNFLQAQEQAKNDSAAQKAKASGYEAYDRLGFIANLISGMQGGYGTTTTLGQTPDKPSPLATALGYGSMGAGILGSLKQSFGGNNQQS